MKWEKGRITLESLTDDESQVYMSEMLHNLKDILDMPELETFRENRRLPNRLFELFRESMAIYDLFLEHNKKEMGKRGMAIRCGPGCANCCTDIPSDLNLIEIVNMYDAFSVMKNPNKYFAKMAKDSQRFQEIAKKHTKPDGKMDKELYQEAQLEYRLEGRPCAFLGEESRMCEIYPNRPISCRMFLSFSDPALCDPKGGNLEKAMTPCIEPCRQVNDTLDKIDSKFGEGMATIPRNIPMGIYVLSRYFLGNRRIEKT